MDMFEDEQTDIIYDEDEEFPYEHERSGNILCEPEKMSFCLGHEAQESLFIDLFKKDTIPHAIIFSGPRGIGKTTMAFRFARFLFKYGKTSGDANQGGLFAQEDISLPQEINSLDIDSNERVARLLASGGHPDFLHIKRKYDKAKSRYDDVLKVEQVREIEPFLRLAPSEGGWRIVIIEDADTMNRNAQNAILKILEEPPSNVLIMLIAHRPGLLIPTIHSRARNIRFSSLSDMVMETLINAAEGGVGDMSVQDVRALNAFSEGSIGQALEYIEQGGLDMMKKTLEHLIFAKEGHSHKIHEFSSSITKTAQDAQYRMFTYTLMWILRKLLFLKARSYSDVPDYIENNATQDILLNSSLEKLISLNDEVKNIFERVDFSNLDRRDAVRSAFLVISQ